MWTRINPNKWKKNSIQSQLLERNLPLFESINCEIAILKHTFSSVSISAQILLYRLNSLSIRCSYSCSRVISARFKWNEPWSNWSRGTRELPRRTSRESTETTKAPRPLRTKQVVADQQVVSLYLIIPIWKQLFRPICSHLVGFSGSSRTPQTFPRREKERAES